jgi:hypothetical protein
MTLERDPAIQALFDVANEDLDGKAFTAGVMSKIDSRRRWSMLAWSTAAAVILGGAVLLAAPVIDAVGLVSRFLPASVIEIDDAWLAQLLSPVNSVAGLLALSFLALRFAYRKIFTR